VELARPDDDELETEAQLRRSYAQTLQELADTLAASVEFGDLLHEVVVRLVECTGAELALVLATASDERVFYILGSSEDPTAVRLPVNRTAHPEVRRALEGQDVTPSPSANDHELAWDFNRAVVAPSVFPIALFQTDPEAFDGDVAVYAYDRGVLRRIQTEVIDDA